MIKLTRTEDIEEVRELHTAFFPDDVWVGDDHEYWIARDEAGRPVGFCSAIHRSETNCVLLSRAAVAPEARGAGLQRRMIRARVTWARQLGAIDAITYVALKNYDSIVNLLKCGFRFYEAATNDDAKDDFHFLRLNI
jgi:GNAT superfamily N-acetyltransferase